METYEIKITGSGTKEQIIKALKAVVQDIKDADQIDKVRWEDKTLFTQIDEE
jgi:hypothetical protein